LREEGSLGEDDFLVLSSGYSLLRSIDHNLRLIITRRSTRLPDPNHAAAKDVATRVGFSSVDEMQQTLMDQMKAIRETYIRIVG
jgi:glutamine synthetase adenylyltransferase